MNSYWLETTGTIVDGVGFAHYDALHLSWLAGFVLFTAAMCLIYRRCDEPRRSLLRKLFACAIVADEVLKMVTLTVGGNYTVNYLPLHLCSINIFLIARHAWKPGKTLDNFLYLVCIPGALAALLFPTWTALPLQNLMHIHSFTVHILLCAYPIMLLSAGDIRPDWHTIPRVLGLLSALACVALAVNLWLDTNYMFLMEAEPGNPLAWFEAACGSHLIGFPVLISAIIALFYGPLTLWQRHKAKRAVSTEPTDCK